MIEDRTKPTPGPWSVDDAFVVSLHDMERVADAMPWAPAATRRTPPEIEANARLIAAAPELLDAVERLLRDLPALPMLSCEHFDHRPEDQRHDAACPPRDRWYAAVMVARAALAKAMVVA